MENKCEFRFDDSSLYVIKNTGTLFVIPSQDGVIREVVKMEPVKKCSLTGAECQYPDASTRTCHIAISASTGYDQ